MSPRREFSKRVTIEIIRRATVGGQTICEGCGIACKRWEVDHIIAEALVIDKSKRLTAADGQLLCSGAPDSCHAKKTGKSDVPAIAKAVRREAKSIGASPPAGTIKSRGFPPPEKPKREKREPVQGLTGLARQYRET